METWKYDKLQTKFDHTFPEENIDIMTSIFTQREDKCLGPCSGHSAELIDINEDKSADRHCFLLRVKNSWTIQRLKYGFLRPMSRVTRNSREGGKVAERERAIISTEGIRYKEK